MNIQSCTERHNSPIHCFLPQDGWNNTANVKALL